MFIHYLELHRCKRFSLRGIDTLKISPGLKTQMVLGSNGAGKSSLLKIGFSVLPGQASDFYKGGFKAIGLSADGHMYELKTLFDKSSPEHIFIRDGEDLNVGRTGAVQKELIRQHFKMTQEIHDVLTGEERFTSMSPLRRREWITKLSDTDFTYVLNLYAKIKKGARDANAVVKHNNNRLITESSKLMERDELESMLLRSQQLRSELDILFQECGNRSENVDFIQQSVKTAMTGLESFIKVVVKRTRFNPPPGTSIRSMEQLGSLITTLQQEVVGLESVLGELGKVSQQYEAQMKQLVSIEGMDEQYIRDQIKALSAELEEHLRHLHTGEDPQNMNHDPASRSVMEEFRTSLYPLSAQQRDLYTDKDVQDKRQRLETVQNNKNLLTSKLANLEGRLEHIETCQESGCPKCGHKFKAGVQDGEYEKLKAMAVQGADKLATLDEEIADLRTFVEGANQYQHTVNQIRRYRQSQAHMGNFWAYVDRAGGIETGKELIPAINLYLRDVEYASKVVQLDYQLKPLQEAIDSIEKLSGESSGIREQYYLYTARIQETTAKIAELRSQLDVLTTYRDRQERFDRDMEEMDSRLKQVDELQEQLIEAIRQSELKRLIKDDQISLAMVETTLTETEVQQGIVADIRKEIVTGTADEKAYRLLMDALSPDDGLIAEQIGIYVNTIIDKMNAVIARIWGYNMAIKPCNVADGDLDYKFPLYTVSEDNVVPDVSKGSTSQVDIVNQAFRLIVYKFLNLDGYPLYLDELGASFDEVHRHNLIPAIKDLIDDSTYSQIFMISHYVDGQNSYPNSEIVVLDESHVNITRKYNEHVEMS